MKFTINSRDHTAVVQATYEARLGLRNTAMGLYQK